MYVANSSLLFFLSGLYESICFPVISIELFQSFFNDNFSLKIFIDKMKIIWYNILLNIFGRAVV